MAQVASETRARIEGFLRYALSEWQLVPQYALEFPTWGDIEQLTFVHEWAIRESALEVLRNYVAQEMLDADQYDRYQQLLTMVSQHRPTVERLLSE